MGKRLSFTLDIAANRLTFRDHKGGQFSVPVEREGAEPPDAPRDRPERPERRMTLREWLERDAERLS